MDRYETMKAAVGGGDAPVLYASLELNEKGFRALLGRRLNTRPGAITLLVAVTIVLVISVTVTIFFGQTGTPTFAAFFPIWFMFMFIRNVIVAVGDNALDIHFTEPKLGQKYVVYDKMSLPFDRIDNVRVKRGRFNTHFRFEISAEDKSYKIKLSVPNKQRKNDKHTGNLAALLEKLEKYSRST